MGKWILFAVASILVGLGAGAVSLWLEQKSPPVPEEAPPPPVEEEVRIQGVVAAANSVAIPAPIEGILDTVLVNVGEEVYEGMLLAQIQNTLIDSELVVLQERRDEAEAAVHKAESNEIAARLEASRAQADLNRARDELAEAQREADRQRMLYREGATPRMVFHQAEEELERVRADFESVAAAARVAEDRADQAREELEAAKRMLRDVDLKVEALNEEMSAAQIVSPINGVVTGMAARQGEEVHPGMDALFLIAVDLSRMTVILDLTPAQMEFLRPGKEVQVYIAEVINEPLEGTVVEMNMERTLVEFLNPSPAVRPGLTAVVRATR